MNIKQFSLGAACLALALEFASPASAATPNDPRFNAQWHLKKIGAPAAWDVTTGSRDIVVAVIDSGVNFKHSDLAANMWRNPGETGLDAQGKDKATNGVDDDGNGYIDDVHGIDVVDSDSVPLDPGFTRGEITTPYTHGTACAGVIGAVGNDAKGTVGVNWAVSIMAIRVLPLDFDNDWHMPRQTARLIEAFQYLLEMKRRGVNIVAASASISVASYSQALKNAIDACGREDIITVFSSGNNGMNNDEVSWGVSYWNSPHVLCISASDSNDALSGGSSYGRSTAHLAAPGENIVTTEHDDFCCTSSATPQVSGAIALLKSAVPNASAAEIRAAILGSVDQSAGLSGKVMSNGRLNVAKALVRLTNTAAPAIVIAAHPAGPGVRPGDPIRVTFSRPMNRPTTEAAIVFTPSIAGRFEWENGDRTVTLIPDGLLARTNHAGRVLRSALDDRGERLDGNFNGVRQDATADDFTWTFGFPVVNDDFADALLISGMTGSKTGTTRNALPEEAEPDIAHERDSAASVWYRWTAPANGWITFDTSKGTVFDSLLGVYTGDNIGSLTEISSSDNHGAAIQSRTSFDAVAGTAYSIAVAIKAYEANKSILDESRMGSFTLSWYATPTPDFTGSQFSPAIGDPGARVTLSGTNFSGATSVLFNGIIAAFTKAQQNNADLRINAVVPPNATSGPITIVTPHGSVTSSSSFTVLRPQLSILATTSGLLEIAWTAGSVPYVLEESSTMQSNSWTPVSETPTLENGVFKVTLPGSPRQRFFRARQK